MNITAGLQKVCPALFCGNLSFSRVISGQHFDVDRRLIIASYLCLGSET